MIEAEIEKEVKRVYKIHQELHGVNNVYFGSVVSDVQQKYNVQASIIFDIIKEII